MRIVIIPGFMGYPEEETFKDLEELLIKRGHTVVKIKWPFFPKNLSKYSFSATITYVQKKLKTFNMDETVILGFSMGGIIACYLAKQFQPKKLGLIVSPYQAGSEDDLEDKLKAWRKLGGLAVSSSKFGDLEIPFSFIKDARRYNALNVIPEVYCPILFIVGEKDDKVSNKATKKLFDKANDPKQWVKIEGMRHKYKTQPKMLEKVNDIIIDFISREEN